MGSKPEQVQQLRGVVFGKNTNLLPSGSMHIASQNMVLRQDGELECRRGIERVNHSLRYDKIFAYDNAVFAHQVDADGGAIMKFSNDYVTATSIGTVDNPSTRKIQVAAAGGRLFITTSEGVRVLDSLTTAAIRNAGAPYAPGWSVIGAGTGTWALVGNLGVAYRYVIGKVLADGTQVLGPPSGRLLSGPGLVAGLKFSLVLPPGLDDSYFVQVYRSRQIFSPATEPDDDLRLVYERNINANEAAAKAFIVDDVVPGDPPLDLRGEYLYTNPNSGEGIQSANLPPPFAEEIVLHKNRLWLGRTTQPFEFSFKLLGVGGANGIANLDRIVITSQSPALEMTAGTDFTVSTGGTASQNVIDTAKSLANGINLKASNASVWAEYASGPDDSIGEIRIWERSINLTGGFSVFVDQRSGGVAWSSRAAYAPELLPYLAGIGTAITFSLQRAANVVTATISSGSLTNALRVGDSLFNTNPSGAFLNAAAVTVTAVTGTTFTYAEVGANAGPTAGFVFQINTQNIAQATQDSFIHRVHYSKPYEFEAFPGGNYVDIGASDKGIIAMRSTRETLWVFKEDGLFRITGDDDTTFDVERMDATIIAVAPECVQPFAESLVAWVTKGVVVISESSFDSISSDIDPLLRNFLADDAARASSIIGDAFLVVDPMENLIRLHLPGGSYTDTPILSGAGEALVFSGLTKSWHRWFYPVDAFKTFARDLTYGVWDPFTRRVLYVDGHLEGAGEGFLYRERPYADAATYADDDTSNPTGVASPFIIAARALWVAQVGKAPMLDKRFDEVAILFRKPSLPSGTLINPGAFEFGFGTENDEQGDSITIFGLAVAVKMPAITVFSSAVPAGPNVRILPPTDASRGQRLWIRIEHANVEEFTINGFLVQAEVLNGAIGR